MAGLTLNAVLLCAFGVSSLHAAYKAVNQAREQRRLRERELRWRQSEQARLILERMEDDEHAAAAMLMLDYQNREITLEEEEYAFSYAEIDEALRVTNLKFSDDEVTIRDCYDHLFYHLEVIAQWIEVELITVYDVIFPVCYLADCMEERKAAFVAFLGQYRYVRARALLERFWSGELKAGDRPPAAPPATVWSTLRQFLTDTDPLKAPDLDKMFGAKGP